MEEVGIAAVSRTVLPNHCLQFLLAGVVFLPRVRVVGTFDSLKLVEQDLVFVNDSRQTADAVRSVQRLVGVQGGGRLTLHGVPHGLVSYSGAGPQSLL